MTKCGDKKAIFALSLNLPQSSFFIQATVPFSQVWPRIIWGSILNNGWLQIKNSWGSFFHFDKMAPDFEKKYWS